MLEPVDASRMFSTLCEASAMRVECYPTDKTIRRFRQRVLPQLSSCKHSTLHLTTHACPLPILAAIPLWSIYREGGNIQLKQVKGSPTPPSVQKRTLRPLHVSCLGFFQGPRGTLTGLAGD